MSKALRKQGLNGGSEKEISPDCKRLRAYRIFTYREVNIND